MVTKQIFGSERTQQDGRTFYTEHDFAFTPSAFSAGDMYRENIEWLKHLTYALRVGDVTYDANANALALGDNQE